MKTAEIRGFLPEQRVTVRAEKAFSCSWFESRYPSSKKGRIPRRNHPSPTLPQRPKKGPITINNTRNPPWGHRSVLLPRPIRACTGTVGPITARLAHLLGMDQTTRVAQTFLTQQELAEMLRLPERTLEDWRLTHAGPPFL